MTEIGDALEIKKLEHQLKDYKYQLGRKKKTAKDVEEAIGKLEKKHSDMEDGLQETVKTVRRRLEQLPENCKFRDTYYEQATRRVYNSDSSAALAKTSASIEAARKKLTSIQRDIQDLEKRIATVQVQLQQRIQQVE